MWGWMVAQDFIIKPGRMSQLGVILTVVSTPWDPASVDSANSISHTLKGRRGLLSRKGWWGGGFSEHLSEFANRLWTSSLVGSMQCVQSNQRRRNVKEQTDWCKSAVLSGQQWKSTAASVHSPRQFIDPLLLSAVSFLISGLFHLVWMHFSCSLKPQSAQCPWKFPHDPTHSDQGMRATWRWL